MTGSRLGIIAGGGDLPLRLARIYRNLGRDPFVVALEGQADTDLAERLGDIGCVTVRMGAAGKILSRLRAEGASDVIMVGRVTRPSLGALRPDLTGARILARIGWKAAGDDTLLTALSEVLRDEGFQVIGLGDALEQLSVPAGPLAGSVPDEVAERDIERGREVVRALGGVDVGQAVIVQQGMVLGVEAIEGTDALLQRAADLRREGVGGVLVKMVKPRQDRRLDLPTIGPDTVRNVAAAGLRGMAIEAGGVVIIDKDEVVALADQHDLFVIAVEQLGSGTAN